MPDVQEVVLPRHNPHVATGLPDRSRVLSRTVVRIDGREADVAARKQRTRIGCRTAEAEIDVGDNGARRKRNCAAIGLKAILQGRIREHFQPPRDDQRSRSHLADLVADDGIPSQGQARVCGRGRTNLDLEQTLLRRTRQEGARAGVRPRFGAYLARQVARLVDLCDHGLRQRLFALAKRQHGTWADDNGRGPGGFRRTERIRIRNRKRTPFD